jgi:hypothetical protein
MRKEERWREKSAMLQQEQQQKRLQEVLKAESCTDICSQFK